MKMVARGLGFLVLLFVLFVFGFGWRDVKEGRLPSALAISKLLNTALAQNPEQATAEFTQSYQKIRADYYKAIPQDKLTYAGM